jgi:lipopolysaccharide/colanic/teichoic acid biosynthesis glycosyltransferase
MSVFPVFIDSRPACFGAAQISLLRMPLGLDTLLEFIHQDISAIQNGAAPHVLTLFEAGHDYEDEIRAILPGVASITDQGRIGQFIEQFEPSDWLLFVDPTQLPKNGYTRRDLDHLTNDPHPVKHMVAVEGAVDYAKERVLLNSQGDIRRIQRYYAGITWVDACAVAYSLVSVAAARLQFTERIQSLTDLRYMLMARGISSQDWLLDAGAIDLSEECGLLHLSDIEIPHHRKHEPHGHHTNGAANAQLVRGKDCTIDPTAQIFGPCILQDGVHIDANATLIGPTLVGAGTHVRSGAILAQCVVAPKTIIEEQAVLRHRVLIPITPDSKATPCPHSSPAAALRESAMNEGAAIRGAAKTRFATQVFLSIKRLVDISLSAIGLVMLSPLMLIVSILIKLTSPGPIHFGHDRETRNGRQFKCWKFRTMVPNAHAQQRALYQENKVDGPQFKMSRDPRITRIGRLLRNSNIDELPQLWNVLKGDMSLIGPRPSPFRENQICVSWRQARLSVRPGITGLWQVCRHERDIGDFHQWIYFDTLYVRHMSVLLDLKILAATIFTAGGRWSVPVHWLIPQSRLSADQSTTLPSRVPILEKEEWPRPAEMPAEMGVKPN